MKILFFLLLCLMELNSLCYSAPHIDTIYNNSISGDSFLTHQDNRDVNYTDGINARYKDFNDSSITSGGWNTLNNNLWSIETSETFDGTPYGKIEYNGVTRLDRLSFSPSVNLSNSGILYVYIKFKTDSINTRGGKIFRWYFGPDTSEDNIFLATGDYNYYLRGDSETTGSGGAEWGSAEYQFTGDTWHTIEFIGDKNNNKVSVYLDCFLAWEHSGWFSGGEWDPQGKSVQVANIIESESAGIWGEFSYDDIYVDYTQARVMIGNSPIFSSCTHREIQIPTSWSDTSITITVNQGSFQDGELVHVFVINAAGEASAGFPAIISGGQLSPPPIQANNLTANNVTFGG